MRQVRADLRVSAAVVGSHEQVLLHRHVREKPAPFRHMDDPQIDDLMRLQMAEVLAQETDFPFSRGEDAGNGFQQRRLAGAVGADDSNDLPFLH